MKIALASAKIVDGDINFNLSQIKRYMKEAKASSSDLVCFGEAFLQGFNALSWKYDKDKKTALSISSPEFTALKKLTKEIGIDILFGYNELCGEFIYSSCALISDGEIIHNYRRISKSWKEYSKTDSHYKEGEAVKIFEYKGKKCLIGLCGDIWDFPDKFSLGEDILFWPVYVSWTKEEWENGGKTEYAEQANLCCKNTLYINSVCEGDAFGGAIHFLDGKTESELPIFSEGLLYVTV